VQHWPKTTQHRGAIPLAPATHPTLRLLRPPCPRSSRSAGASCSFHRRDRRAAAASRPPAAAAGSPQWHRSSLGHFTSTKPRELAANLSFLWGSYKRKRNSHNHNTTTRAQQLRRKTQTDKRQRKLKASAASHRHGRESGERERVPCRAKRVGRPSRR